MSTIESEVAQIKAEARKTVARVIALDIINMEAQIRDSKEHTIKLEERLNTLKALNLEDIKTLQEHFRCAYVMIDDRQINVAELLKQI